MGESLVDLSVPGVQEKVSIEINYFFSMKRDKKYPCSLVQSGKIREASLHVHRPWKQRLYARPFAVAYAVWILVAAWVSSKGRWDELWWVPLVLIGIAHALFILACQWSVKMDAWITCRPVEGVEDATLVLVIPREHGGKAALVPLEKGQGDESIWFYFQRLKFTWDVERKTFKKLLYPVGRTLVEYQKSQGLTKVEAEEAAASYGKNTFDMPVATFWELFREHAVAPFFVFQVFCVGLWCLDEYWYYSVFTLLMLVMFESTVVGQRLKNMSEFRTMSLPNAEILVRRGSEWVKGKTEELLPGDIILLTTSGEETAVPCDLVLLAGTCIVNEAMISGESTPLLKEPLTSRQEEEADKPLDLDEDRNHVILGGTKILQLTKPNTLIFPEDQSLKKSLDSYCVAYVLRTGFGTLQGRLVRTMMFTSERMTANNAEAFAFILFLLIFALAAAAYVLYNTWGEEGRSRFKILVECALIVTAVVPPELPMELSLAVNNSLIALSKYAIFCMEPFRIPLAGRLDVCCFDKTGTLTGENLVVRGVAGVGEDHEKLIESSTDLPKATSLIIATCHSLFRVNDRVVGDPMEKTALDFVGWTMANGEQLVEKAPGKAQAKILHRFPFSSALKRMSCLVSHGNETVVSCKGAPEVIETLLSDVPSWYRAAFTHLAHRGARVLALAHKTISRNSGWQHYPREQAESGLKFAGFLVFHCPLKTDSKAAIEALKHALHHVVMITGDNSLTAVHTAYELDMVSKSVILLSQDDEEGRLKVELFDRKDPDAAPPKLDINWASAPSMDKAFWKSFDMAMTGEVVDWLAKHNPKLLNDIIAHVTVFARASPSQKELILTVYKQLGLTTLMCGDGTNDVGALKQSHVGVALLDGRPDDLPKILKQMQTVGMRKRQIEMEKSRLAMEQRFGSRQPGSTQQLAMQKKIEEMTLSLEQEETPMVRLGDASVAAPFTSKISTIQAVCNLVRQGRCTLVTTMQMYKILALNSLISAYGLSVLHLAGVRYGDFQVTVTGMLLAGCFLFLSKAQPIEKLAPTRPQPNIFNWYVLASVLLQFLLHVGSLWYVMSAAVRWSFQMRADENTKFVPGLVNTTVYLISLLMQVSTFVVNYQGRPFRESLVENKPLRNCLLAVGAISVIASSEMYPEFNEWLQLVPMPPAVRGRLLSAMAIDFGGCLFVEWICKRMLFDARPRIQQS